MQFIDTENTVLVLIDVQEKLFPFINTNDDLKNNLIKLIKGCQTLNIPIIVTEQYSKGLGSTIPEIVEVLENYSPIEKTSFSCIREDNFRKALSKLNRNQILLAGIETHICVYQTAKDLDNNGFYVHLVTDCMGSREIRNKTLAIDKLSNENNIMLTSCEMALFELLKDAKATEFKKISQIIK